MLRAPSSSILRWAVLCGYALLVALGHGGWHLVTGESCEAHGHSHASPSTTSVSFCSHGHRHVHLHETEPEDAPQGPEPQRHAPHDSDHCAVCAVFATALTVTNPFEFALTAERIELAPIVHETLSPAEQTTWPDSRGPPVVA